MAVGLWTLGFGADGFPEFFADGLEGRGGEFLGLAGQAAD